MVFSTDFPLREKTTILIGGKAKLFFAPRGVGELKSLLPKLVSDYKTFFLGGGSNTIFGDFKGVVVSSEHLKGWRVIEETPKWVKLEILAGTSLRELIKPSIQNGWCGLETLFGIPRITLGGAIAMNAGAYGLEIGNFVERVFYIDPPTGEIFEDKPAFGYRSSPFPRRGFVFKATLKLPKCGLDLRRRVRELNLRRRKSQPLNLPTAGSTFKNPKGFYAGKLLEEVGLRGFCTERGLCFSKKHANFLVNLSKEATFEDALRLIDLARERVFKAFGILLEEEVKIVSL